MSGHLFVHIGPPKSATTSLQCALEGIDHPRFVYGGVLQPRNRNHDTYAKTVLEYCTPDGGAVERVAQAMAEDIRRQVAMGKCVVISEEMLLLSQERSTWREKLQRLKALLGDIPTTVLVTVRNPEEALPSLYQEIYRSLPIRMKLSFAAFCKSEQSNCYDFHLILNELDALGFEPVRLLHFDIARRGRVSSQELFGKNDVLRKRDIPIGHQNAGLKRAAEVLERRIDKFTLKNFGQVPAIRWVVDRLNLRSSSVYRRTVQLLDRIQLRPSGYRSLVLPAKEAERFAKGYLMARKILESQAGIPADSSNLPDERA